MKVKGCSSCDLPALYFRPRFTYCDEFYSCFEVCFFEVKQVQDYSLNAVMVHERIQSEKVDVSILGTPLTFRNYRKAKNRFLKVGEVKPIESIFHLTDVIF